MSFHPTDQFVCATEAVYDYHVAQFPAVVNHLVKCIHWSDCVARILQIPSYGDCGTEHIGCFDLLTDPFLRCHQFNFVLSRVCSSEYPTECGLSRGSSADEHEEHLTLSGTFGRLSSVG